MKPYETYNTCDAYDAIISIDKNTMNKRKQIKTQQKGELGRQNTARKGETEATKTVHRSM